MPKSQAKTITLLIPSLEAGGMERVMSILANNFAKNTHLKVHLIFYDDVFLKNFHKEEQT